MRNQEGRIELQKKVHRRICMRGITFLLYALLSMSFCWFFRPLPPPSQVMPLQSDPYKDTYIAMGGILCDDIISETSKIRKSTI